MVRSRERFARFAQHDFPDFAQEFLRRNVEYRAQHAQARQVNQPEQLARTWGLHFPVRSSGRSAGRASLLAFRNLAPGHAVVGIISA